MMFYFGSVLCNITYMFKQNLCTVRIYVKIKLRIISRPNVETSSQKGINRSPASRQIFPMKAIKIFPFTERAESNLIQVLMVVNDI